MRMTRPIHTEVESSSASKETKKTAIKVKKRHVFPTNRANVLRLPKSNGPFQQYPLPSGANSPKTNPRRGKSLKALNTKIIKSPQINKPCSQMTKLGFIQGISIRFLTAVRT